MSLYARGQNPQTTVGFTLPAHDLQWPSRLTIYQIARMLPPVPAILRSFLNAERLLLLASVRFP
jgi:hypothetical protein